MVQHGCISGIELLDQEQVKCQDCMLGKAERAIVLKTRSSPRADAYGDHVHLDLWGPSSVQTVNHHKYAFFIIDDYCCWTDVPTMTYKKEVFGKFVAWEAWEELQYGIKVKIAQSDCCGEFLSTDWDAHIVRKGTLCKPMVHNTLEHNGIAERTNYTIFNMVRTFLVASGLPKWLWGEALQHAVHVYQRSAHSALSGKLPYEVRFGTAPDVSRLWPWGSVVYVHQDAGGRSKLEPHALEAQWLGFDSPSNGHWVYWPLWRTIAVERSVRLSTQQMRTGEGEQDVDIGPLEPDSTPEDTTLVPESPLLTSAHDTIVVPDTFELTEPVEPLIQTGKQARKASRKIRAIQDGTATARTAEPLEHALIAATSAALDDPLTLKEALLHPDAAQWQKAMDEEIVKLMSRNSWVTVDHPGRDVNVITGKWVFRTKRNAQGNVTGYRARFVA
jgi:hypothetical protein